jgi:hypothetical protein
MDREPEWALSINLARRRRSSCPTGFSPPAKRNTGAIDESSLKQLSMLRILHASCATALDAFRAADNPVDTELVLDLEKMVERTRVELERFATRS